MELPLVNDDLPLKKRQLFCNFRYRSNGHNESVSKNDEFLYIYYEELCIKKEEFCLKNDEFCRLRLTATRTRVPARATGP